MGSRPVLLRSTLLPCPPARPVWVLGGESDGEEPGTGWELHSAWAPGVLPAQLWVIPCITATHSLLPLLVGWCPPNLQLEGLSCL